ncbi:MAG: hypothetical protein ABR499_22195 [Gemmatimonadaceae bacterium]
MGSSRHQGGADILASAADLYVALGVRLRERPGVRWMIEMHPATATDFDREGFDRLFGLQDVKFYESPTVRPGEYRLSPRGLAPSSDSGTRH